MIFHCLHIYIHNFYTLQRKFVRLSFHDKEATYVTHSEHGSPSILEEKWATLMGEDESFQRELVERLFPGLKYPLRMKKLQELELMMNTHPNSSLL